MCVGVFVRVCVCVPNLMWHLKRCDSSWWLRRGDRASPESAPSLFTPQNAERWIGVKEIW